MRGDVSIENLTAGTSFRPQQIGLIIDRVWHISGKGRAGRSPGDICGDSCINVRRFHLAACCQRFETAARALPRNFRHTFYSYFPFITRISDPREAYERLKALSSRRRACERIE